MKTQRFTRDYKMKEINYKREGKVEEELRLRN